MTKLTISLLLIAGLAGCSYFEKEKEEEPTVWVQDYTTNSRVRCVIATQMDGIGISCDWANAPRKDQKTM